MPITLPVPGGGGATTPSTYYSGTNLGEYQFVSVSEIIDNFQAAYVGEGKILENVLKGDVTFHAFRALQELHYDTVRSCKSQEIEVCSSLKMPLPHDYVNYVKLAFIDNNGVEHIIYPARNTSNPFAIQQNDDCSYAFEDGDLMHQKSCVITSLSCSAEEIPDLWGDLHLGSAEYKGGKVNPKTQQNSGFFSLNEQGKYNYLENWKSKVDDYCNCTDTMYESINDKPCGELGKYGWSITDCLIGKTFAYDGYTAAGLSDSDCADALADAFADFEVKVKTTPAAERTTLLNSAFNLKLVSKKKILAKVKEIKAKPGKDYNSGGVKGIESKDLYIKAVLPFANAAIFDGNPGAINDMMGWDAIADDLLEGWPEDVTLESSKCNTDSDSWNRYKTGGVGTGSVAIDSASTVTASTDSSAYSSNFGERYGIDPQYAQGNGSYYIDCMRGNIHFSSNLASKTIVLKYISDGVGTADEAIIHKFAEEAMYKWIAYGCASARVDTPEYLVARLKKERFAETRKAKIRLSNIKIEEISQVFRGKSKWIKH